MTLHVHVEDDGWVRLLGRSHGPEGYLVRHSRLLYFYLLHEEVRQRTEKK